MSALSSRVRKLEASNPVSESPEELARAADMRRRGARWIISNAFRSSGAALPPGWEPNEAEHAETEAVREYFDRAASVHRRDWKAKNSGGDYEAYRAADRERRRANARRLIEEAFGGPGR